MLGEAKMLVVATRKCCSGATPQRQTETHDVEDVTKADLCFASSPDARTVLPRADPF